MKTSSSYNHILTLILFLSCFVFAQEQVQSTTPPPLQLETAQFQEISEKAKELGRKYHPKNVLLVLDIDNTLLAMKQDLGSDQWFTWQSGLQNTDENNPALITKDFVELLKIQGILYTLGEMRTTEPDLSSKIQECQKSGFHTLLLTSRGYNFRDATRKELERNNLDFKSSALKVSSPIAGPYKPYKLAEIENYGISKELAKILALKKPRSVSYAEGVFMTAGQHKGAMLLTMLRLSKKPYKAIIFVDDHKKHTDRVFAAFEKSKIELVTYRYSREDPQVNRFKDSKKKHVIRQWRQLSRIIQNVFHKQKRKELHKGKKKKRKIRI